MRVDCQLIPQTPATVTEPAIYVVIDVLRASSTIVVAFMNGCKTILPAAEVEEAFRLAEESPGKMLIGGERGGRAFDGFDLGNSPAEYASERVGNRNIVLTTTNGTRAFRSLPDGASALVGSFLNLSGVARYCLERDGGLMIVSSGGAGRFSMEDTVCAGGIVDLLEIASGGSCDLTDAARASQVLYRHFRGGLVEMFRSTDHGRYLVDIGMEGDLEYCSQTDITDLVPIYRDGKIELPPEG